MEGYSLTACIIVATLLVPLAAKPHRIQKVTLLGKAPGGERGVGDFHDWQNCSKSVIPCD